MNGICCSEKNSKYRYDIVNNIYFWKKESICYVLCVILYLFYSHVAHIAEVIKCLPALALSIYEEGLQHFRTHPLFLINYAKLLARQQLPEKAFSILRASVPAITAENDRMRVWEAALTIHSQYLLTRPIQEILQLEKEFAESCPSERTKGLLSRLNRYTLWGVGELRIFALNVYIYTICYE